MFHRSSRNNLTSAPSQGDRSHRQVSGPTNSGFPAKKFAQMDRSSPPVDPRRVIVDHIIRDCYSKYEKIDGAKVPEIKYNTHLNAREYSQYPLAPPPDDLSPAQRGSLKSRILVICTKQSGRVLLQKGKYNEEKRVYQIGRTWDLEELKCVKKVSPDAMILLLNKDYYWQSGEGAERMNKFIHHLMIIYQRFTGRFPDLTGISLSELGLTKRKSLVDKTTESKQPFPKVLISLASPLASLIPLISLAPKVQDQAALYGSMDFTANGKLPMKPMQVMEVDRPGKESQHVGEITTISAPNRSKFLSDAFANSANPPSSEVFNLTRDSNNINDNKPDFNVSQAKISDTQDQNNLGKGTSAYSSPKKMGLALPLRNSMTADDIVVDKSISLSGSPKKLLYSSPKKDSVSIRSSRTTSIVNDSVIDTSIREIEDFMDTQFGSHKRFEAGHKKNKLLQIRMEDYEDATSSFSADISSIVEKTDTPVSEIETAQIPDTKFEKDAEIDELLDEIGWKATDPTETFVRLLTKELAVIKHNNVEELINLNFGKEKLAHEGKVSTNEILNLINVFKKMEFGFQRLAPEISDLELNSKGLQVEAVNNKILFNDLNELLSKIKVNTLDLQLVSNYDDFNDISQIPVLEIKLLTLYDALKAIGSRDSDDGLSQMKALQQYQKRYEAVAMSFLSKFVDFIHNKFVHLIEDLSRDIDTLFPRNLLKSFTDLTSYVGLGVFTRCISEKESVALNNRFNSILNEFLNKYFASRLKLAKESQSPLKHSMSNGYDSIENLGKRRSGRFGSTRLISKFSTAAVEEPKAKASQLALPSKDTTFSPRTILRMVQENKELILVIQFFCCNFFHSVSSSDYSDFINSSPFDERLISFKNPDVYSIDYKTNSNELLLNMNAVFGIYINKILKTFVPADLQVPQVLLELESVLAETKAQVQNFVAYSFVKKLIDRYKNIWVKFIAQNVSILQKSEIRAKGPLLPGVRNLNTIVLATETALQDSKTSVEETSATEVLDMVKESYGQLTKAMVDLFGREDPLLKYNSHDEKERSHRNVAILQNLFSALQQLMEFTTPTTAPIRMELDAIFKRVQNEYTTFLLRRFFSKMLDFVTVVSEADATMKKKDNKILIKALVSSHSPKEMTVKVTELHHKMERHYLNTNTVLEQDLLITMWKAMEERLVELFTDFFAYARSVDRDIDECITVAGIRSLFKNVR